ncbi:ABC transporter ATP-binding protein [Bauldia litoralis]|uniref:ABC transporter ATP-binding protein n=4 Tax=Bauldia litoralis TaxID=665467 RepID=UPI00326755CC
MTAPPLIRLKGVTKRFGDLVANDAIDLDIAAGEVVALLGENGAGKSTLMKLAYGYLLPDAGSIEVDGRPQTIQSPRDAMALGIGMVFQQFSLLPALSVLENLLLAWPRAGRWRSGGEDEAAMEGLRDLAPEIAPGTRVRNLAVGERQLVELAKVLNLDARLVILDEPTSVLTPQEASRLHRLVRGLADQGRSVVIITHKLADVRACADRVAVMRRGKLVDAAAIGDRTNDQLVEAMVGKSVARRGRPAHRRLGPPRLMLRDLCCGGIQPARNVDLDVRRGEILGIAGVAGNGQWALAETVAGLVPPESGEVLLDGESVARRSERKAFSSPVAYIPEEPIRNAVVGSLDLAGNLALRSLATSAPLPDPAAAAARLEAFDVRPPEPGRRAATLSGGNLQKLVAARELGEHPAAIVACYPTMGLDVHATEAILGRLVDHASTGAAVLWIGEEIDDLLAIADRIAVIHDGRIVADLLPGATDAAEFGRYMAGGRSRAA